MFNRLLVGKICLFALGSVVTRGLQRIWVEDGRMTFVVAWFPDHVTENHLGYFSCLIHRLYKTQNFGARGSL